MADHSITRTSLLQNRKRTRNLSDSSNGNFAGASSLTPSNLEQIYRGNLSRFERYRAYDRMDKDSDIARALDIIAEHCTEKDTDNRYFTFNWYTDATDEIGEVLRLHLDQWARQNEMEKQLFSIVRNLIKYGDWFLFRNPNTFELYNIHPSDVLGAVVDNSTLDIIAWVIRDFRWNVTDMEVDVSGRDVKDMMAAFDKSNYGPHGGSDGAITTHIIPALHILHFSMANGKIATNSTMYQHFGFGATWPFGQSWLEQARQTFIQRELLEGAALIHRVQRAPTRYVWYIDVGRQRPDRAEYIVNDFKNQLNQTRVPQAYGADRNQNVVESEYNPASQLEDYYLPVGMDSRGSRVETLEGHPWENMPDLDYFTKKMMAALRVPYAWLQPSGEGGITPSDGRQGQATQEEIEFSRFCSRVHTHTRKVWDHEFKLYCRWRDVSANWADFDLAHIPPTDYQASRERARLTEAANTYSTLSGIQSFSARFLMKMVFGWSDDVIAMNEQMKIEETNMADPGDSMSGMDGGLGGGAGFPMGDDMSGDFMGNEMGNEDGALPLANNGMGQSGDMAGLGMGAGGGQAGSSGMEAFIDELSGDPLFEADDPDSGSDSDDDDLKFPTKKSSDTQYGGRTPNDKAFMSKDPIKGNSITTLAELQRIRLANFKKSVDYKKRLKILSKVYSTGESSGGGMGGL